MPVAFVLSGGGTRGDFQAGALDYLVGQGIRPDIIVSTSVGSLNGLMLAHGAQAIPRLRDIWMGLRRNSDMYVEAPWLTQIDPAIKAAVLGGSQGGGNLPSALEAAGIGAAIGTVFGPLGILFGALAGGTVGGAIAQVTADRIKAAVRLVLEEAVGLYDLTPIRTLVQATLNTTQVGAWAQAGGRLRMALVGLRSGEIAYVGEDGSLYDYDLTRVKATGVSLVDAAIASCSIGCIFQPVAFKNDLWLDGGHREQLPVRAALQLGADDVWVISCSPIDRYGTVNLRVGGRQMPPATGWRLKDIALRTALEIQIDELAADDVYPSGGWPAGVNVRVVKPAMPVHDFLTVHPALIRIAYDYGYMEAANIHRGTPNDIQSAAITSARLRALQLEGKMVPNIRFPGQPVAEEMTDLRTRKAAVRTALAQRLTWGAPVPPWVGRLPRSWEEHQDARSSAAELNEEYPLFARAASIGLAAPAPGALLAVTSDAGGRIMAADRTGSNSAWTAWSQVSGGSTAPGGHVAAVSCAPGRVDLLVAGTDSRVYTSRRDGAGAWSAWAALTGATAPPGSPVAAVARSQDIIDIFWADAAGRTMTAAWNPGQNWVGPLHIQSGVTGAGGHVTACCRAPNFLDIFCVGVDGRAYRAAWSSGGAWGGWWQVPGFSTAPGSRLSPTVRTRDNIDVFAADGTGRTVVARWMPGAADWTAWSQISGGMTQPGGSVDAVSRRDGQLDAFTVGGDRRVYRSEQATASSAWSGWSPVAGLLAPVGGQIQPISPGLDLIDLIVADDSGAPAASRWEPSRPWTPWQSIGLL